MDEVRIRGGTLEFKSGYLGLVWLMVLWALFGMWHELRGIKQAIAAQHVESVATRPQQPQPATPDSAGATGLR